MLGWFSAEAARASRRKRSKRLRVLGYVLRQEFQGDEAPKLGVLSLVDHTHPAAAQLLDDAVVRDGLADHGAQAAMVGMR